MSKLIKKSAFSLYNASAGSGKTYTLVKEYLKIILSSKKNDTYRNILAITFTNKAVYEMKSRIVDSLFDFSKDNPSQKSIDLMFDLEKEIGLNQIQIKNKSQLIIKNIIHNYAAFDISTIDKFTHKVIRSFAFDLDLPFTFDVSIDTENLLQESIDAIIAEAGNDEVLTKLLVDFTMEKTDDDKSWDVSKEIFNIGKLILNENYREEIFYLKDKTIPDFVQFKDKISNICQEIEIQNSELAVKILQDIDNRGINLKSFSGGYFPNHLKSIQDCKFNPKNKTYHEIEDIKINKTAKDINDIEAIIPEILIQLDIVYKKFEKKNFYEAFLKNITPLSLLNTISNELAKIQQDKHVLSISEFNKLIFEHIQNQPALFIYERLGEKYKHFFIDEFQDTSQMQWQNLIPLIDNALSSEDLDGVQGSLMIVGDPKQSIYRWRGGKAEQFIALAKDENPFSNKNKTVFNLETNYRSYEQVIDFNNNFFKFLSHKFENENYKELYQNQSFQKSNHKKGGYVNITFIPEKEDIITDELDDDDVTQDTLYLKATLIKIKNVINQGFLYADIVLLTRNNNSGVLLANYLTENNIPIISSESLLINASSEVQFLINFLKYFADKNDKESLANALYYLANNIIQKVEIHNFIYTGIQCNTQVELEKWLQTCSISLSFVNVKKKSLYELIETIIIHCIPSQKNNAYIQYFLDIVLERDVKYNMSVSDFLSYWHKNEHKLSIPSSEGSNAIKIMTIHKSKGLEFPVVIFPFAEEDFSRNKSEKMWLNSPSETNDFDKFLIDKSSKLMDYGQEAVAAYKQKNEEDLLDNINVLYVALTRAEEQLYIISSAKSRNKQGNLPNNLASFFIEFLESYTDFKMENMGYEFGSINKVSVSKPLKSKQKNIVPVKAIINPQNIKIAQREALMWGSNQLKAIEFGNVLHEILSFVNNKNDIELAITKALEIGLIAINQKNEVQRTISKIVLHDQLTPFFNEKLTVFNEQNIIKKLQKTIKPDRIVVNNQKVYLLDYKTGYYQDTHKEQLYEYEMAISEIGYIVQKKVLVYIREDIEIVHL